MDKRIKKKLINILLFLGLMFYIFLLASCGPSKEEIDAREKAKADSVKRVQQAVLLQQSAEAEINGENPPNVPKMYNNNSDFYIGIYNINGCEYISFGQGKGCCAVVHAGNCPNHNKKNE